MVRPQTESPLPLSIPAAPVALLHIPTCLDVSQKEFRLSISHSNIHTIRKMGLLKQRPLLGVTFNESIILAAT